MIRAIIFDFNRTLYDPDSRDLNPGALELLDYLKQKDYKMCLISKKAVLDRRAQITEFGLDKYFIDIQVIEGEKTEKGFERCYDLFGVDNGDIAVVGDRVRNEIALGNRFQMVTFWYKNGKFASEKPRNEQERPRYTIRKFEELKEYLSWR